MEQQKLISTLAQNLESHLSSQLPLCDFSEVSKYGVLPPGKLFRPILAAQTFAHYKGEESLEQEISNPNSDLSYFCSALEIHHAYTLMHDDLPCMDNDDTRRGKPSTHIKYGEWQSLLAADGLLNISYALCSNMKGPDTLSILRLASWALGPRGLILGQALDLSHQTNESFQKLIWTHQLKTGRLIQLSIIGAAILAQNSEIQEYKNLRRFSEALGLAFQLIDDLTELCVEDLSSHEKTINPWPRDFLLTCEKTTEELEKIERYPQLSKDLKLSDYFQAMSSKILANQHHIEKHLEKELLNLNPVMTVLERLSHLKH